MANPLAPVLESVVARRELVHVTHSDNLTSIRASGLRSPRSAKPVRRGLGAEGSNVAVVQLFDYTLIPSDSALHQLVDFLDNPCFETGATLLILSSEIRLRDEFVSHHYVRLECKAQDPAWLYYPATEVWWRSDHMPREWIVRSCPGR